MQDQKTHQVEAGARGKILASMHEAKLPIPAGFIISAEAFAIFCEHNRILEKIEKLLPENNSHSEARLKEASKILRKDIKDGEFPDSVVTQIVTPYIKMGEPRVMLFPSALSNTEQHGHVEHHIFGVQGDSNLFDAIKNLWSQFFQPRLLAHRQKFSLGHMSLSFAVAVQEQPVAKASAVMFTDDPTSGTKQTALVKVVHGEGALEGNLDGADYFWIRRGTGDVYKDVTDTQRIQMSFEGGKEIVRKTAVSLQKKRKLTAAQLMKLGKLAKDIQQHFFFAQKVVVILSGEKFHIVECSPLHQSNHHTTPTPPPAQHLEKPVEQSSHVGKKKITVGMQYFLNPSGHLPHTSVVSGFATLSATPILSQFKGQLTAQKKKVLEHELTHAIEFFLHHIRIQKGIIFDFGHTLEDHDQIEAELESINTLRHREPSLPITLVASARNEQEYREWMMYWHKENLKRASHVRYALKITSPAPIYSLSTFIACGVDAVMVDLDAVDTALHGTLGDTKRIQWSEALTQFFKHALKTCEEHGVVCMFASARLVDRDMLSLLSNTFPIEWIAPSSLYTQLDEVFKD